MMWNKVVVANFRYYISNSVKVMRIVSNSLSKYSVSGLRFEAGTYGICSRKGTDSTEIFDVSPSEEPIAICGNTKHRLTDL
jgi:hypothetical protein